MSEPKPPSSSEPAFALRFIEHEYGDYFELVEVATGHTLGSDGGEPEDQTFSRDWSWVPEELNKLASERAALRAEVERLRAQLTEAKAALGYPVPGDFVPELGLKCGLCEARALSDKAAEVDEESMYARMGGRFKP